MDLDDWALICMSINLRQDNLRDTLTNKTPKFLSYRNQSIDLLCKSIDWFLYDCNFGV